MGPIVPPPVVHLELHTRDSPGAQDFYRGLCGWEPEWVTAGGRPYVALELGPSLGGGIVECRTERALWLPYAEVRDVAEVTERARTLGADILLEPREGPAGWRSVIATPCGAELAFWQGKR
jgi:predicted enzyme related to lactoylglutathione lyase